MVEQYIGAQQCSNKEQMPLSTKVLLIVGTIITLGLLSFIVYQQTQLSKQQTAIEQQVVKQKELSDNIVRSQSEYATKKDLEKFVKNSGVDLSPIKKDLEKLQADITSANVVVVKSDGDKRNNLPSTSTGPTNPNPTTPICKDGSPCPNVDPFGYLNKQQKLSLEESFGNTKVPLGEVNFSAWQEKPWGVDIKPREYNVISVIGTDENQRHYVYNKFRLKVDNKEYDIPISKAETKQEVPYPQFSFWNPRLFLGFDGGYIVSDAEWDLGPSINIGFMSYGQYKNQPDWSFLELGLGYQTDSERVQFVLTPFTYNIGNHIPLMNNLYIGPSVMVSPEGKFSIMGGVRVGL